MWTINSRMPCDKMRKLNKSRIGVIPAWQHMSRPLATCKSIPFFSTKSAVGSKARCYICVPSSFAVATWRALITADASLQEADGNKYSQLGHVSMYDVFVMCFLAITRKMFHLQLFTTLVQHQVGRFIPSLLDNIHLRLLEVSSQAYLDTFIIWGQIWGRSFFLSI